MSVDDIELPLAAECTQARESGTVEQAPPAKRQDLAFEVSELFRRAPHFVEAAYIAGDAQLTKTID
jgi:hypothetical protein